MFLRYGPTDNHVQLSEAEIDEEFGKQDIARVFIKRGDLTEADVQRGVTEMLIVETTSTADADADFGGILRDIEQSGSLTEFIVESFERYGRDGTPTTGGERWEAVDDSTIISDGVSEISQLSAGTINTVRTPMTMVFSHTSQAKKIRETEAAGGGELKYRPDKTVDYVAELGSDKTATVLSPDNQNIVGEFNAERKGGQEDLTHLRLVGAGEARHQRTVNFVPQDDPFDYENDPDFDNVNRYSASHWSSGDRQEWDVRSNKDHTDVDSLVLLGETIVADIQDSHIEATANVRGVEVSLGDEFTIDYPEEDISQTARVVKLTTKIDSSGFIYQATLSSRQQSLNDPDSEQRKDTDRYNLAFEGSPVTMTTGGGRQPVSSGINYEFSFYYPAEVEYEHRVKLRVKGFPYRAYSEGAANGGGALVTSESGGVNSDTTTAGGSSTDTTQAGGVNDDTTTSGGVSSDTTTSGGVNDDTTTADGAIFQSTNNGGSYFNSTTTGQITPNIAAEGTDSANIYENDDSGGGFDYVGLQSPFAGDAGAWYGVVWMSNQSQSTTIEVRWEDPNSTDTWPDSGMALVGDAQSDGDGGTIDNDGFASIFVPTDAAQFDPFLRIFSSGSNFVGTIYAYFIAYEKHDHNFTIDIPDHDHTIDVSDHTHSFDWLHDHSFDWLHDHSFDWQHNHQFDWLHSHQFDWLHSHDVDVPNHQHDPLPGVIETFNGNVLYPSNCDVLVNGQSVGTSFGDGTQTFEQVADLEGLLNEGQWNTIEVTSDTIGHIMAHLDVDVYRQILGNG